MIFYRKNRENMFFFAVKLLSDNKIFAFGQAITDASIGVLRSTLQGSLASLPQKLQAGIAASNGELNPSLIKF